MTRCCIPIAPNIVCSIATNSISYSVSLAAARALIDIPELSAEEVARKAMAIASDMCIYTNSEYTMDSMDTIEDIVKEESNTPEETATQPTADGDEKNEKKDSDDDDDDDTDEEAKDKKDGEEEEDNTKK